MSDQDPLIAVGRAATRAAYHLLRAGVETVKAMQAVLDELSKMHDGDDEPPPPRRVRIDLE